MEFIQKNESIGSITIEVWRKTKPNCIVLIMYDRNTKKYCFVNLTSGHVCNCRFYSVKEALEDMKKNEEVLKFNKIKTPYAVTKNDVVNRPSHYTGNIECIDAMIQQFSIETVKSFCLCNAFKYLFRCTKKHNTPIEDIKKAQWYINKYLELYEKEDNKSVQAA